MKRDLICAFVFFLLGINVYAQDAASSGLRPPTTGRPGQRLRALLQISPAYQKEALQLILAEANRVARELRLPENLPIVQSNLVAILITPPRMAERLGGAFGNITTSNYTYYVSVDDKFSFLDGMNLDERHENLDIKNFSSAADLSTNAAYQSATQILNSISVNVAGLNADCSLQVGSFTVYDKKDKRREPGYWVDWFSRDPSVRGSVAEVEFAGSTKTVRHIRISRSDYILRQPLVISNLDELLSDTNGATGQIGTRAPGRFPSHP